MLPSRSNVLQLSSIIVLFYSFINFLCLIFYFQSPTPTKVFSNDRHRKENLISLTSRKEQQERPPLRRKESRYSPEEDQDKLKKDVSFQNQSHVSQIESRDSFGNDLEYDEESEDESIADDHRERFKSERSNIITLTPAKRRTDIPDTLGIPVFLTLFFIYIRDFPFSEFIIITKVI